jgi:hypothetical protein
LLALVVEKNRKREEEKPIDYVARQEILLGATERVAMVHWWIAYIISIVLILAGLLSFLAFLAHTFFPEMESPDENKNIGFPGLSIFLLLLGFGIFFPLRSGKREYERLKRKKENQGQS